MIDVPDLAQTSSNGDERNGPRRSVEVEYWVIDEGGRLTAAEELTEASPGAEQEFIEPLIEIKTSPCESSAELRSELYTRLRSVLAAAEKEGKGLVPLATPLNDVDITDRPHERTRIQSRVVGDEFDCVRHCAGTHVHFEQLPGREIDQLNTLTALDPALALVNSSPFFRGSHIAASARSEVYRWKAYESLPQQGQLWSYAEDTEEWATRLERRYEEFVTEAIVSGVPREQVESCFTPESGVWTPVKLRGEFSTVEWRSPDTALPSQILELADQLSRLLSHLDHSAVHIGEGTDTTEPEVVLPEFDVVQEHARKAIRNGLSSAKLRSYLTRMGLDVSAFEPLSSEFEMGTEISPERARDIRLSYAERLKEDIVMATPARAE